jgi:hypothetical protein
MLQTPSVQEGCLSVTHHVHLFILMAYALWLGVASVEPFGPVRLYWSSQTVVYGSANGAKRNELYTCTSA